MWFVAKQYPGSHRCIYLSFLYSPLIWNCSSGFLCRLQHLQFWRVRASYFVKSLSIQVWYFLMVRLRLCILGKNTRTGMLCSRCIISGDREVNFLVWEILKQIWIINISSEKENQEFYRKTGVVCTSNGDYLKFLKDKSKGLEAEDSRQREKTEDNDWKPTSRVSRGYKKC